MIKTLGEIENNQLPVIETERLILRGRRLSDAEDIFAFAKLAEVSYPAGFPPVESIEDEIYYLDTIYPENLKKKNSPQDMASRSRVKIKSLVLSILITAMKMMSLRWVTSCTQTIGVRELYQKRQKLF